VSCDRLEMGQDQVSVVGLAEFRLLRDLSEMRVRHPLWPKEGLSAVLAICGWRDKEGRSSKPIVS
jgi:hypothetical protein